MGDGSQRAFRFLVPLDGSVASERVVPWALNLAATTNAEAVLFRVALPWRATLLLAPALAAPSGDEPDWCGDARQYLDGVSIRFREAGTAVHVEVADGEAMGRALSDVRSQLVAFVGDAILSRAGENDIDLVVLARHGATAEPEMEWGSVAAHVLKAIKKPIVLVPVL